MRNRVVSALFVLAVLLAPMSFSSAYAQRGGLLPRLFKSGQATRSAFAEVVKQAKDATVELISDGKVVALGAVVDGDGYVVTKASQLGDKLEVRLGDKSKHVAKIVDKNADRFHVDRFRAGNRFPSP